MTAAIRRQLEAAGVKLAPEPSKPRQVQRRPVGRHNPAPVEKEALRSEENEPDHTPCLAAQHYIGPFHLQVANGTHFPERMRAVVVGPADEGLLRAVLEAMHAYCSTPSK